LHTGQNGADTGHVAVNEASSQPEDQKKHHRNRRGWRVPAQEYQAGGRDDAIQQQIAGT
jgi:hypothetical protein